MQGFCTKCVPRGGSKRAVQFSGEMADRLSWVAGIQKGEERSRRKYAASWEVDVRKHNVPDQHVEMMKSRSNIL